MTVVINSSVRISLISGSGVTINAPVVPSFTTDDIVNVNNANQTLTEQLATKQNLIGAGNVTASDLDVNVLAGTNAAGLATADLTKLHAVTALASELNQCVGGTSAFQTQINTINSNMVTGAGVNLTGLTVPASQLNNFFSTTIVTTAAEINAIHGITATADDLNVLTGAYLAGVLESDLVKLHAVTATAAQLNTLVGITATGTDLNKLHGMTSSQADLNTISGLAGYNVSATQLQYLSGLSQNVQNFISAQPNLSGLTASPSDLNVFTGISAGTGAFAGSSVTATNLSYLSGATANIQSQINSKMTAGGSINITQITGAAISITELNNVSGATSNIQSQINTINTSMLPLTGGALTGALSISNGSSSTPAIRFANSTGTGIYRVSADAIGIAVASAQYGQIDANATQLGMATTGSPYMRVNAPGVSAPTYAFIGDTATGMYRSGTTAIGFAANATSYMTISAASNTITIGGSSSTNAIVTVSGKAQFEKLLAQVNVNALNTGATSLYTVPTGRTCVVTALYIVATTITGSGTVPKISFGYSGSYNQMVDSVANPNLFTSPVTINTSGQILTLQSFATLGTSSGAAYTAMAAGSVFTANVTTAAATFSAYTLTVFVKGFEY